MNFWGLLGDHSHTLAVGRATRGHRDHKGTALFHSLLCRRTAPQKKVAERLFEGVLRLCRQSGLIPPICHRAAIDATGFDTRYVSSHFVKRSDYQSRFRRRRWPKLSAVCDTKNHIVIAAYVNRGPGPDCLQFDDLVIEAADRQKLRTLVADKGYESEGAHRLCRETLGITSIIPTKATSGRKRLDGRPNAINGKYRRLLHKNFPTKSYNQRWQIETVFSMIKRRLGSWLGARRPYAINREIILKVLTHDLMIVKSRFCFQRSIPGPILIGPT